MSRAQSDAKLAADAAALRWADRIEAAAFRDLFAAAPPGFAAALGLEIREMAGATLLLAPGIPDEMFNRVIGLGVEYPASERALDAVIDAFRQAGARKWWLHLTPAAEPLALRDWIFARGFTPPRRRAWAKMLHSCAPPPEVDCELQVRRAKPAEWEAVAEAICVAFGMPPAWVLWFSALAAQPRWRAYAVFEDARVVGGGFLYAEGRNAWLGAGGVRPEARKRHGHRALMALRIADAMAAGCSRITTETGEPIADEPNPSLANMAACGFVRIGSRLNFAPPAA